MTRPDEFISDEHQAELEDRAAELVERDLLLGHERVDRAASRAAHHEAERAVLAERARQWEAIKERSGWACDYGGHWNGGVASR